MVAFFFLAPWLQNQAQAEVLSGRATTPVQTAVPLPDALRFEHFTSEDGLSQNAVFAIYQDRQGFLWVGTQDGLNRYDGYSFTVFRHDPDNPNSLSHSSVLCIAQDKTGLLWFGTWGGGLNSYDPRTGKFTRYQHNDEDASSISNDIVPALLEDQAGRLWVGTMAGLDLIDPVSGHFTHYTGSPDDPSTFNAGAVSTILEDPSGDLWIGTGSYSVEGTGLYRFNPRTTKVVRYQNQPKNSQSLSSNTISAILRDPGGALWIATGGYGLKGAGLNRLDLQTGQVIRYQHDPTNPASLATDDLMGMYLDPAGSLWLGSWGGGLDRLDTGKSSSRFIHYQNNPYDSRSLTSNLVWSIYQDRSGVLWVGTALGGLNKINPQIQRFGLYRNDPNNPKSLSGNSIGPMMEDKQGNLWIGTLGTGLDRFDRQSGFFSHYTAPTNDPFRQQKNSFLSLTIDHSGVLWVGTLGGLGKLSPSTGQITYYQHDPANPDSIASDNVGGVVEDGRGGLWVATLGGLDLFDRVTNRFIHMKVPEAVQNVRMIQDRAGNLWLGTWGNGVIRVDPTTANGDRVKYTHYHNDPNDSSSLGYDSAFDIFEDSNGTLWFATERGLEAFDPHLEKFTHLRVKDGLPSNNILCVLEDTENRLWISTTNGIARYDPKAGQFHNFDARDGLQGNEFDSGSCLRARDGRMFFGGTNGLTAFYPYEIQNNPFPPPLALTGFRVFNEPFNADLSGTVPIRLSYQQDYITFEFVGLDYHAPQKNQYAYKLEGFDKDWVNTGTRRFASYTNLPGGSYTFRVRASNNDGVWNETGINVPILVTPPFWETWWFAVGLAIGAAGLFYLGVRWRLETVRQQTRRLETQVAQRTAELVGMNRLLEEEVTQRERAEEELARRAAEELQQSEARFISMYQHAEVGIVLTSLERRFLRGNPEVQHMFGYNEDEFKKIDIKSLAYPEDREVDESLFSELAEGKRDAYAVEKRYIRKDGSVFWVHLNYSLVRGPDGAPRLAIGMLEDISDQKSAAEALQQSEARFRAMFDNASVGMALMTLDRKMIQINQSAARITGYSVAELMRMDPTEITYPEDRETAAPLFQELVSGKRGDYQAEKRYVRKNGEVFWGRVTYSMVHDSDCCPMYLIGLFEDIDEEKRSAEKLAAQEAEYRRTLEERVEERTDKLHKANLYLQQEIEQRKKAEAALAQKAADEAVLAERSRLARDLHDAVTQTLFAASLIAEVLPELWKVDPDEAKNSTDELRQLTRGALAEMRTLLLELRPAALTQTRLEDLIRQLSEAVIGRARLPIELRVEGQRRLTPEVQVALYRICQEALNNIVKYAHATQVWVDVQLSPAGVLVSIRDNGAGFDPSTVRPTSLGLRIMRERSEEIGADFSITSAPGKGTLVEVAWEDPEIKELA